MTKKLPAYPELEKAVKAMLTAAENFEEKRQGIETALKFEALKLKARGNDFGKGFDAPAGSPSDDDF